MAGMAGYILSDPLRRFRVQSRSCAEQCGKQAPRVCISGLEADPQDLGVTLLDNRGYLVEGQEVRRRCQRGQPDSRYCLDRRPARQRKPWAWNEVGPR